MVVSNIRDMIADGQEELVRQYIGTFSCLVEDSDGKQASLNSDIEHFTRFTGVLWGAILYLYLCRHLMVGILLCANLNVY